MAAKPISQQADLSESLALSEPGRQRLKSQLKPRLVHGGAPSLHKRKTVRPFSAHAPVQVVLRSSRAKGAWSLKHRKHQARIRSMIYVYAERFKVKIYQAKNTGNELHLLVKAAEKKHLSDFLRVLAGRVAVVVSGARKHLKRVGKFWDYLCFTKLVNWGQDFFAVRKYIYSLDETGKSMQPQKKEWKYAAKVPDE